MREEEGIPELEEEDDAVVVKEVSRERPVPGARSRHISLRGISRIFADDSTEDNNVVDKGVVAALLGVAWRDSRRRRSLPCRWRTGSLVRARTLPARSRRSSFARAADAVWALTSILEIETPVPSPDLSVP